MKYLILILVLTGVLLQNFGKFIVYTNFELNRSYIANNLCVKKDVKNNTCKGSCHLKKQFDKTEEQEQKQLPQSHKVNLDFLFCQYPATFNWHEAQYFLGDAFPPSNTNQHYSSPTLAGVFQPPENS